LTWKCVSQRLGTREPTAPGKIIFPLQETAMNGPFSARLARAVEEIDGFTWGVSASEFFALYALWFGLLFGLVQLLQWRGLKNPAIMIMGILCYEIPALLRLTIFAPPYMHNWGLLGAAMILGGGAFLRGFRRITSEK
jgi:hypothetical protein